MDAVFTVIDGPMQNGMWGRKLGSVSSGNPIFPYAID